MAFNPVLVGLLVAAVGAWYYFAKTTKGQAQWAALKAKLGL